jgi:hypothetical protein
MKFTMTKMAAGLALAVAATGAQAVGVTSFTIQEIGGVAGMSLTSATAGTGGGLFYFGSEAGDGVNAAGSKTFVSTGTTDGAIIANGVAQGNGAFATPFTYGGSVPSIFNFYANTAGGGVTASWTGGDGAGTISVGLSGFGGYWNATAKQYPLFPDAGTLVTNVQTIGGVHYYTMDWSHVITAAEDVDFQTQRADWHLEGVMATAPVPEASTYGMMLAGLGLVGFAVRRRKLMA